MSSIQREYEEKRDYIRMYVDATVELTDPESGDVFQGDSKDLSAGGVAFVTNHPFDIGLKLDVTIRSARSKLPPLKADFVVSRCELISSNEYKVAGSIENVQ